MATDLLFLDEPKTLRGVGLRLLDETGIDGRSSLSIRVGERFSQVQVSSGKRGAILEQVARDLLRARLNAHILYLPKRESILILPRSGEYTDATYPVNNVFSIEEHQARTPGRLGDLQEEADGSLRIIEGGAQTRQELIVRLISARNSTDGYRTGYLQCAGPERWFGQHLTREVLDDAEEDIREALNQDGRFRNTRVLLAPRGENAIQPVISLAGAPIPVPVQYNSQTGAIETNAR